MIAAKQHETSNSDMPLFAIAMHSIVAGNTNEEIKGYFQNVIRQALVLSKNPLEKIEDVDSSAVSLALILHNDSRLKDDLEAKDTAAFFEEQAQRLAPVMEKYLEAGI